MNSIRIPTSRYIELEYPIASMSDRAIASIIDVIIISIYVFIVAYVLSVLGIETALDSRFDASLLFFLPVWFYSLFWEVFYNGRTPGKLLMKMQVIQLDGHEANIGAYLLRWMLRIIDVWLFFGVAGLVCMGVTQKTQRIGDILAGTTVIKLKLDLSFDQTIFVETEENYQPQYPQVRGLSDKDATILKEMLDAGIQYKNEALLLKLSDKVCQVLGIKRDQAPELFIKAILKDYNHFYG